MPRVFLFQPANSDSGRISSSRAGARYLALGLLLVLAAPALVSCGLIPAPESQYVYSHDDDEDEEESEEELPNLFEHTSIMSSELQKYLEHDAATMTESILDTMASYYLDYREAYEARFYEISGVPEDAPVVLTENSTAEEMYRWYLSSRRIASNLTIGPQQVDGPRDITCGPLDWAGVRFVINSLFDDRQASATVISELIDSTWNHYGEAIPVDIAAIKGFYPMNAIVVVSDTRELMTRADGSQQMAAVLSYHEDGYDVIYRQPMFLETITNSDGNSELVVKLGQRIIA